MSGSFLRRILDKENVRDLVEDLEKLVEELVNRYKPSKIIIAGSLAEGRFVRGLSDIDVLVVVGDVNLVGSRFELYNIKDVDVEVTIVSEEELGEAVKSGRDFYVRVLEKGIVVYPR